MSEARYSHIAALLPNGKVIVAGGHTDVITWASKKTVEIYDPATNSWSAASSLSVAHGTPTAHLLPNGKLVLIGGESVSGDGPIAVVEVYDPASNTWSSVSGSLKMH